jgi:hypothetical protein
VELRRNIVVDVTPYILENIMGLSSNDVASLNLNQQVMKWRNRAKVAEAEQARLEGEVRRLEDNIKIRDKTIEILWSHKAVERIMNFYKRREEEEAK